MKKIKLSPMKKFLIGLFVVLAAYSIFDRMLDGVILKALSACIKGGASIIAGIVISYLLNPILNKMERSKIFRPWLKLKKGMKLVRVTSIILLFLFIFLLVGVGIAFIVPSVYGNVKELVHRSPEYFQSAVTWMNEQPWLAKVDVASLMEEYLPKLTETVKANAQDYLIIAGRFLIGTGTFLFDTVMAFLVAFFLLQEKEKFSVWFRKLWRALISNDYIYGQSLDFIKDANKVFSDYIVGRLIESLVLAIIAYIGFLCFGVEYAFLFAFIIGVTNLIPYFGPFIGAVPVILLVIFDDPMKAVWIAVFLTAIQQLDSFVLTPVILGEKLKASPLWILIGVILGGAVFGVWGMILGSPLVVILVNTIEKFVQWRQQQMKEKKLSVQPQNES